MAMPKNSDCVAVASTTTGTGTLSLGGAVSGYRSFSTTFGTGGNTEVYYSIRKEDTGEFEVGIGTFLGATNQLQRDHILSSSNSGSLVTLPVGNKIVFVTDPAESTRVFRARRAADTIVEIRANGSQSGNLFECFNSSGVLALSVSAVGALSLRPHSSTIGHIGLDCEGSSAATTWDITPFNNTGSNVHSVRIGRRSGASTIVKLVVLEPNTTTAAVILDSRGFVDAGVFYIGATPDGTVGNYISRKTGNGFSLRSGVSTGNVFSFLTAAGDNAAQIYPAGTSIPDVTGIITREKGDARYAAISAARFKEQIEDAVDLAAIFPLLRPRRYVYGGELPKSDERIGTPGLGFVLEDMAEVLPEACRYLGEGESRVLHSRDDGAIIAVLHAKIAELEARLAAVETMKRRF